MSLCHLYSINLTSAFYGGVLNREKKSIAHDNTTFLCDLLIPFMTTLPSQPCVAGLRLLFSEDIHSVFAIKRQFLPFVRQQFDLSLSWRGAQRRAKKLLLIITIHSQPDLVVDFVTHDNTSSVATVGSTLQGIFLSRYIL